MADPGKPKATKKDKVSSSGGNKAPPKAPGTAAQCYKEVQDIEQEVVAQGKAVKQLEEQLNTVSEQLNQLIKYAVQTKGKSATRSMLEKIKEFNEKEQKLEESWIAERQKKEELVRKLRLKYCDAIKAYHMEKEAQKKKGPSASAPAVTQIDISKSQLWTGATTELDEGVDWHSITQFSNWNLKPSDIKVNPKYKLGETEFAVTYRGLCGGQEVAVKVLKNQLDQQQMNDLAEECKRLKSIHGPTTLLLFLGAAIDEKETQLVYELAKNRSLDAVFSEGKFRLTFIRKIKTCEGLAKAVSWLHQKNILHLRLKPSNLMITRDWKVKVSDYGLPFKLTPEQQWRGGYVPFMAPEFLKGEQPSIKSDVYSYGMCLWYLLTQKMPFDGEFQTYDALKTHIISGGRPPIPSNTPASLKSLIERCWNNDPAVRPDFTAILEEKKWEQMLMEAITKGEEEAMKMWLACGTEEERQVSKPPVRVPWETFIQHFCDHLNIKVTRKVVREDDTFKALRAVLGVSLKDPSKLFVSFENFEKFLKWFGPVRRDEGRDLLNSICELVKEPWFHGDINREQAEARLTASQNKNGFIVRYSQKEGKFTISWNNRKTKRMDHMRIDEKYNRNLAFFINNFSKQQGLAAVSYERFFDLIFTPDTKAEMRGYVAFTGSVSLSQSQYADLSGNGNAPPRDDEVIGRLSSLETTWTSLGSTVHFVK